MTPSPDQGSIPFDPGIRMVPGSSRERRSSVLEIGQSSLAVVGAAVSDNSLWSPVAPLLGGSWVRAMAGAGGCEQGPGGLAGVKVVELMLRVLPPLDASRSQGRYGDLR